MEGGRKRGRKEGRREGGRKEGRRRGEGKERRRERGRKEGRREVGGNYILHYGSSTFSKIGQTCCLMDHMFSMTRMKTDT